jgi:hypothetical protein
MFDELIAWIAIAGAVVVVLAIIHASRGDYDE